MELSKAIKDRRSVRKYTNEKISREVIEEIIELSRFSPSWSNFQISRYNIIEDRKVIEQIADLGSKGFVYNIKSLKNAPGVLVISTRTGKSGVLDASKGFEKTEVNSEWEMFDAGLATQTFCLAAFDKGVSTCIFGIFDKDEVAKIINLPSDERVCAVIVYGIALEQTKTPPKKEVNELIRYI